MFGQDGLSDRAINQLLKAGGFSLAKETKVSITTKVTSTEQSKQSGKVVVLIEDNDEEAEEMVEDPDPCSMDTKCQCRDDDSDHEGAGFNRASRGLRLPNYVAGY